MTDTHDPVNNPKHYDLFPGQQSIDVIRAALTPEEFIGFCKGNTLKYRLRAGAKGDASQDLKKADWYAARVWEASAQAVAAEALAKPYAVLPDDEQREKELMRTLSQPKPAFEVGEKVKWNSGVWFVHRQGDEPGTYDLRVPGALNITAHGVHAIQLKKIPL